MGSQKSSYWPHSTVHRDDIASCKNALWSWISLNIFSSTIWNIHFDAIKWDNQCYSRVTSWSMVKLIPSMTDTLLQVLNKCCEIHLKLNPDKCVFGADSVQFYGNIIGQQGLQPDPMKSWHHNAFACTNHRNWTLSSFLGMCNYLAPYTSKIKQSDITATLRELTRSRGWTSIGMNIYDKAFRPAKNFM